MVIFDTNILIELYRANPTVKETVQNLPSSVFYISSVTAAEFLVGAKNKEDLKRLEKHLSKYTIIPIDTEINDFFLDIVRTFAVSHRPDIPDALIAATVLSYGLPLYTLNRRHFQFIPGIELI